MAAHVRKTFDDPYGRHALVMGEDDIVPSFGRIDVIKLVHDNRGASLHPSRVDANYSPAHMKGAQQ